MDQKRATNENGRCYVGIDVGSVSVNSAVVDDHGKLLFETPYKRHFGKVEETVHEVMGVIKSRFQDVVLAAAMMTGNHGQTLAEKLGCHYEFETICQVLGARLLQPDVRTIISMGGQDTALFQISLEGEGWELEYFNTNGPCASGTGSFIDQQAQRLATALYKKDVDISQEEIDRVLGDFIQLGMKSEKPADVACRCTVFTKSDMIHLQNKGERLEDIIFGLHSGNARNYMSTIVSNRHLKEPILFVGGLSLNALQVRAFKEYFPGLQVPDNNTSVGAIGAALHAKELGLENRPRLEVFKENEGFKSLSHPVASKLELRKTIFPENNTISMTPCAKTTPVYLGIDIGSTTTKYVCMDESRRIVYKDYVHTQGKPIETTQNLLEKIQEKTKSGIDIAGVATTGSGRNVVGDFLNADLIIDEITAHARGAIEIDSGIDTIFEIGGQDSKYIAITNTFPLDFDMNKVCAAGTGSFLHELANKYGINIVEEFQEIALSSNHPVKLAERCTVFMESDLVAYHQKGVAEKDLMAGLCYAIVHNYLNRVVGKRPIGKRIMFLGGPSLNKGVVAAFEEVLDRGLIVPKHREVLGAYGAAISVQEHMLRENRDKTVFRGLESAIQDRMQYREMVCRADSDCHNQCKLKVYDFDGRKSIWGGDCGRYETAQRDRVRSTNYFRTREEIWMAHMDGLYREVGSEPVMMLDDRPTVGMQRSLYALQTGVLWVHFFHALGFCLLFTPPTNSRISSQGIEAVTAETCYPVKVSHGHVKELSGKTRYLFLPALVDMETPNKSERGFYCPLVQANQYMLRKALDLDEKAILKPVAHFKYDLNALAAEMSEYLSRPLGRSRGAIRSALKAAIRKQKAFENELKEIGKNLLVNHDPRQPLVIVTGRPYNLYDEKLNLRLGQNLAKIGVSAIPMDFVDTNQVDLSDFPNMYWGLGAQILRTAKMIKEHPNYFGLHLTNFSCGADSFLEHFYKHVMGKKPYLILELDEHSAVAGMMTRLEAFGHVIDNALHKQLDQAQSYRMASN
jgi:predicted CoA-substrate-specific enzyme activase